MGGVRLNPAAPYKIGSSEPFVFQGWPFYQFRDFGDVICILSPMAYWTFVEVTSENYSFHLARNVTYGIADFFYRNNQEHYFCIEEGVGWGL